MRLLILILFSRFHSLTEGKKLVPLFELRVDHPAGETFTADTDSLKYTITLELVHNQPSFNHDCQKQNNDTFIVYYYGDR